MNTPQIDNASSIIKLQDILFIFANKWAADNNAKMLWMEYTAGGIKSKLNGLFSSSRLWKLGAHGLTKVNAHGHKTGLTDNQNWEQDTTYHLRGTLVICFDKKITYADQGSHRKHAIHISDVYQYLKACAQLDSNLESTLNHLSVGGEDDLDVYFNPSHTVSENFDQDSLCELPAELSIELNDDDDNLPPPPTANDLEPALKEELHDYIALVDAQLQNPKIHLANTDSFFNLVEQLEDSKEIGPLSPEQETLYFISLAFCASLSLEKNMASQAMTDPCLTELLEDSQQAFYHYYCLSVIAMKIESIELSKIFIDKSIQVMSKEESDESESIKLFGDFVNQKHALFKPSHNPAETKHASNGNRLSVKNLR